MFWALIQAHSLNTFKVKIRENINMCVLQIEKLYKEKSRKPDTKMIGKTWCYKIVIIGSFIVFFSHWEWKIIYF